MAGPRPDFDRPPGPEAREDRENAELQDKNELLERRSVDLAREYRELRERGGDDEPAQTRIEELRREMSEVVEEHFNVRTELRRFELHRVERELDRLREAVEHIRQDLERREEARGSIVERRLRQLLGEDAEGW